MFMLADPTPDTSGYMIAGYIVIFGIMLIYLISMAVRNHNLKQDLDTFKELDKQ